MERRLAAVLAADIVGYSRLMGENEAATLSDVKRFREELIEPKVGQYHGRIVKLMGDGALMEFPSAVDAVVFAVELQCAMAERNAGVPEDRQIIYRIGINVGDIVIEDDDIFGDGVNIAARLESIAEPGGICVARNVINQVKGKLDLAFELVGRRKVKNISQAVTVHRVVLDDRAAALVTPVVREREDRRHNKWRVAAALTIILLVVIGGSLWRLKPRTSVGQPVPAESVAVAAEDKPSIAVLPFTNISGDEEQEYFSDGMTDDLITDLSNISSLLVIARNTTFAYKGTSPDIKDLAERLGVQYVLEGSVRRAGQQMRINAQLIDAKSGTHLWAERYDGNYKDVFALQDKVTNAIVSSLALKLTPGERRRIAKPLTQDPEAYDLYLKALRAQGYFTKESNLESQTLFLKAIERDPTFAAAYAALAQSYSLALENLWTADSAEARQKAVSTAQHAIKLDEELPYAYWSLGRIYTRAYMSKPDLAKTAFEKAVALNPNYADGYLFLALTLNFTGHAEQALGLIEKAMRLNPDYPFWYLQALGMSRFFMGNYEAAVRSFESAIERNPAVPWLHHLLIASYGKLGMRDEAEWAIVELESLGQPATIKELMKVSFLQDPLYRETYEDGLRKAGMPEE
jgi:TolB-like protein/class 3 adenylate cyclase/Flp pilus assembly protein TadD